MRSSGGTNLGLAWSVVALTKSRIACLAGPSFHDGSAALTAAVCAEADPGGINLYKIGSNANDEIRARRSMAERGSFPCIFTSTARARAATVMLAPLN